MFVPRTIVLALVLASATAPPAAAVSASSPAPSITLAGARTALDAAVFEARRRGVGGAFAVVDAGGNLVAMDRLDGTFAAAAHVSIGKARTAAMFRKPTRVFEEAIAKGRTSMVALTDFTPLQGGVPIELDGQVIGAVGVSGASSALEDDELAVLAAAAVGRASVSASRSMPSELVHLESDAVRSAFARGAPLLETGRFKVHASRRERGGLAEVHADETDVFYVMEGSAVLVTGGSLVGARHESATEMRGSAITGGTERRIAAGDVVVIPSGTPHWFKSVDGPVLYYVVKVIEPIVGRPS